MLAHEHGAHIRFVLLVGTVSAEFRAEAEAAGADVVVEKADLDEVVRSVRRVLGLGGLGDPEQPGAGRV